MTPVKKDRIARQAKRKETFLMRAAIFWDILSDAVKNFSANSNGNQAAALAFYAILSAIPLFILTIIATGYVFTSHPNASREIIDVIRHFHPYFSEDILVQLGAIESKRNILGWLGLAALVWFSAMIFNSIESALNNIFSSTAKRSYLVSKALAISMIPLGWVIGFVSVVLSYVAALLASQPLILPGVAEISLGGLSEVLLRYLLPYLLVVLFVGFLYRIIPTAEIRPAVALAGAAIFGLLMEIAKQFFTWYLAHYTRYDVIFGSLEAVVILVIWVFYVSLIFLFCAEMMSSYLRRDVLLLERALLKPHHSRLKVNERLYKKFGRTYAKGAIVFEEGDPGREMFYILSGRVHLERVDCSVKKTLAKMGPGQYFGEIAALIDVTRTATARAAEESHLAVIDAEMFGRLIRENREAALAMLREFSMRLKNSNAALEEFADLWTRLVITMHFLDRPETRVEDPIQKLTRMTGKSPDEIKALIAELSAQGVLIIKDGLVVEVNRAKMRSLIESETLIKCLPDEHAIQ
jgi:YihY family inner membrane protein